MKVSLAHRAIGDILAVYRAARPAEALRWTAALASRLPECAKTRSISPADRVWARTGASFRTPNGAVVSLPAPYTPGAREMYCRNVYLRTGLVMPTSGWVVDLGANRGLFTTWAAVSGARVVAVEAQAGFAPLIRALAEHNGVGHRVHIEIAVATGSDEARQATGLIADDQAWAAASHGTPERPTAKSLPQILSMYCVDTVGLLKVDIEGGEFSLLDSGEDLSWLSRVRQMALELHPSHGDIAGLIGRVQRSGFAVKLLDNSGHPVIGDFRAADYAYCWRP